MIMDLHTIVTIFIVIFSITAFVIVVLNLLVIIAILRDPLKKLRGMFNLLLLHLCICNFLCGAISLPVLAFNISRVQQHVEQPTSYAIFATHSIYTAMVFSTFSLSIDRYKAIRDPIYHRSNSSIKRVCFYILGIWTAALIEYAGFFLLGPVFGMVFQATTFPVMVVAVAIMHFRIRSVFKYHDHQDTDDENNKSEALLASRAMIEKRDKIEKDLLDTCKLIVGLQIISWLPVIITNYGGMFNPSLSYKETLLIFCLSNVILLIGPFSDPLVCIWRLKNFKESIKCLFYYE